jgi:5-methylcytosine-specific restriction endonuclease McrA
VNNLYLSDGIISTNNLKNVPAMLEASGNVTSIGGADMAILTRTRKCQKCGERKDVVDFLGVRGPIGFCNSCRLEKQNTQKARRQPNNEGKLSYSRLRALREFIAGGKQLPYPEWKKILDKYGNKCLCCGSTTVALIQDHILPISMGGKTVAENIQPLCRKCNGKKYTKYIDYRPF